MSMKTIFVPLEDCNAVPSMLETARLAAQAFGAYVEGLYIRRALPGVVVADIGGYAAATPDLAESFEEDERQRAQRTRERFDAFLREKGISYASGDPPGDHVTAGWFEDIESGDGAVGMHARLFDLTVVGRPTAGLSAPAVSTLEAVLFDSGRPILIAPPEPPWSLGETVVVSWNASTETARAIAFAMPMLARAKRVVVLAVEGAMVPGPAAAEAARHLKRNGIAAEAREIASDGRGGGGVILAEARALNADLLIKGAYTHSRLRQMIFGGPTSHILAEAELPVLMAH